MTWFVKSRRAQNTDDYETWVQGGVSPTLNAFDNGNDTRATVLIFTAQRVGEPPRIYENVTPSLLSRMGTGGNNTPMIVDGPLARRLTPLECERLMGWPDNHTLYRADGKTNSDSARYKMCGNGVATPVARWIAEQLKGIM